MKFRIPSPSDIENRYVKTEHLAYGALARTQGFGSSIVAALVLALGMGALAHVNSDGTLLQFDSLHILRTITHTVVFSILISLVGLKVDKLRKSGLYILFSLVAASLFGSIELARNTENLTLAGGILASTPVLCGLSWGFLKLSAQKKSRGQPQAQLFILYTAMFVAVVAGISWLAIHFSDHDLFRYFWMTKHVFLFITCLIIARNRRPDEIDPLVAINPVHSFRGALWPEETSRPDVDELTYRSRWWQGCSNLFVALLIFTILTLSSTSVSNPPNLFLNYIDFFLIDIASFNILTGIARIFGYQVQDATRFVLLSRTPADTWRRGSVYNYIFILRHIYFPVTRIVKSSFAGTLAAFSFFVLTHWGGSIVLVLLLPGEFGSDFEIKIVYGRILHALIYACLVYTTSRRWFINPASLAASSVRQWASVVLTHATYIVLVYIIYVKMLGVLKI